MVKVPSKREASGRVTKSFSMSGDFYERIRADWYWGYTHHVLDEPNISAWVNAVIKRHAANAPMYDDTLAPDDTFVRPVFSIDPEARALVASGGPMKQSQVMRNAIAVELEEIEAAARSRGASIERIEGKLPNSVDRGSAS